MDAKRTELLGYLNQARQELISLSRSLSPKDLSITPEVGGWTVKDILSHVANSEAGLVATAARIAAGEAHAKPGFDLHAFNQREVEKRRERSIEELLAELDASRATMVKTLEGMTDEHLEAKGFMRSGLPIDVMAVFRRIGDHERTHCQEIRTATGK